MVIQSFQEKGDEVFFRTGKVPPRKGWASVRMIVKRKFDMLHYASELKDLRSPPGNRLESLSGELIGYYSIRINDQWRIVFKWDKNPHAVRIMDYH